MLAYIPSFVRFRVDLDVLAAIIRSDLSDVPQTGSDAPGKSSPRCEDERQEENQKDN